MSSKTGIWPRETPRTTESHAEQRLYRALAKNLPAGWTAWHSLRIRTGSGIEGEGDFVIAIPNRGFLVLEVKGGQVEMRDGRWFQNGRALDKAPREQAHSFAKNLLSRLKDLGSPSVPFGILTIFPDTIFSEEPTQDNLRGTVLGQQDLPWLVESIAAKLDDAFPEGFHVPGNNWPALLHRLWGETWVPRPRLGHKAKIRAEDRLQLDRDQIALIDSIAGNRRVLIKGVAGSGKTILAREAAVRMADEGKKVLFLCFTDALAKWLDSTVHEEKIEISTVSRYAVHMLLQEGLLDSVPNTPEQWAQAPLKTACDALPQMENRPEVLIIDEAQDFGENEWMLIEALSTEASTWIFYDPAQAFWPERKLPKWVSDCFLYRLNKSYRCPEPVLELSKALQKQDFNRDCLRKGFENGALGVVSCPSATAVEKKVEIEIQKLRSEGFAPGDIAVISLRGRDAEGAIAGRNHVGATPLVRADDPNMEDRVIGDTFLRFKGLERPAVIVTDLRLVKDRRDVRMHIALTRALDALRIVGPAKEISALKLEEFA